MMNNLPTDVARTEFKSDVVIAMHLKLAKLEEREIDSILDVVSRALSAGVSKTEKAGMAHADLVLATDTTSFTTSDYLKSTELKGDKFLCSGTVSPWQTSSVTPTISALH